VPTVLLIRHGRTAANAAGILAGDGADIGLDAVGEAQARALAARLAGVRLAAVVAGPLRRCRETADMLMAERDGPAIKVEDRLTECDYGDWTGRPLRELSRERLWRVVQVHPSAVTFPRGESMRAVQTRAVDAVREHDSRVAEAAGHQAIWLAVSHSDVIKCIVADALGMHLDHFQRLVVDPGSVTALRYAEMRPVVVSLNDTGGNLSDLRPRRRQRRPRGAGDAVGGGASRS
jgi:probable phosphomutase (TIGR03848 family)